MEGRLRTRRRFQLSRILVTAFTFFAAQVAFAFEVTDTQGARHELAGYKGRWVVVNFWATWCVPCIQEIPEIAEFQRSYPKVRVIGIAMDAENPGKVKQFAQRLGHDYPLVLSDAKVQAQLGEPRALPWTKIYDPSGKLVYDRAGRVTRKSLEEATGSKPAARAGAPSAQRAASARITRFG
jgi:thiol-disulfide isomerase/thioredoxin